MRAIKLFERIKNLPNEYKTTRATIINPEI